MQRAENGKRRERVAAPDLALSVIVPTRDEAGNVSRLVEELSRALVDIGSEIIFVDDSEDQTPDVIAEAIASASPIGPDIFLIHRAPDRRYGGLGGAVVEGLRTARGTYVCVIDGDLQHPPSAVRNLLDRANEPDHPSMVIGTRYSEGGSSGLRGSRALLSRFSNAGAKRRLPKPLAAVSDPMAGFFLFERSRVDPDRLRPNGFKIMLEVLVRTPGLRVAEVGYDFGNREWGSSKASAIEVVRLAGQLRSLRTLTRHSLREGAHTYDIHGLLTVQSDARLPELESFRVRRPKGEPSIRVRLGKLPAEAPDTEDDLGRRHLRYRETFGNRGFAFDVAIGERVDVLASPPLARSPHVLYTNIVEPILRWRLVEMGYALAHGAVFVDGEQAFMVTARTDTGKTTTMLKLLDANPDFGFIADDLSIVQADGTVWSYPKPLTISAHTAAAVERPRLSRRERATLGLQSRLHSRGGRRFAFILARTGLPVATMNMAIQFLVPPPKYAVDRLIPGVPVVREAQLTELFVIQRDKADSTRTLEPDEAREILLANTDDAYGFPPYETLERFLLDSSPIDLRTAERNLIGKALNGCPAAALSSSTMNWADRIPLLMNELTLDSTTQVIDLRTPVADANGNGNGKSAASAGHGSSDGR